MDGQKRKRRDIDREVDGKRTRVGEDNGVKKTEKIDGVKGSGDREGDTGLDLNADPNSDSELAPVGEPVVS